MYLTPEAYKCYSQTFKERAGEDGFLSQAELEAFFRERKMNVSKEKMNAIMQEVDADGSGFVDESEFLSLMAKAAGAKKRKVGPGACSLASLVDEGWTWRVFGGLKTQRTAGWMKVAWPTGAARS